MQPSLSLPNSMALSRPQVEIAPRSSSTSLPPGHWTILWASLPVAAAARVSGASSWQITLTAIFFLLSTAALVRSMRFTLTTKQLGPALLTAGCWLYFSLEAMAGALEDPPFRVPSDLRISESRFSPELVGNALICVAIFQLVLAAGYTLRLSPALPVRLLASRFDTLRGRMAAVQLAVAMCVFIPLYGAFGTDYERAFRVLQQARAGSLDELFQGLDMNFYWVGLFGSTVLLVEGLIYSRRLGRWRAVAGALLSAPLWMTGARHLAIYLILPVFLAWLLTRQGRHHLRQSIRAVIVVLALLFVLQTILLVRAEGWDRLTQLDFQKVATTKPTLQFNALLFAVYLVPEYHDYFRESMTPFFLTHWIPRKWWTGKPVPEAWTYYNGVWVENRKTNVTPSVIGQYYINWGLAGVVIIGFWLGWLTSICDRISQHLDPALQRLPLVSLGLFYAFIFCSFRYYTPYYLQYWLFGTIVMIGLTRAHSRVAEPRR